MKSPQATRGRPRKDDTTPKSKQKKQMIADAESIGMRTRGFSGIANSSTLMKKANTTKI